MLITVPLQGLGKITTCNYKKNTMKKNENEVNIKEITSHRQIKTT